ncbi:MAG TPA: cytochrome c oxidase subunit 3 [Methylocella sp.]|nr:cytochrome c oxidase subunit 3 [Methylocella sp.]
MNIVVLFFAVLAVIAAWWLSHQGITTKPWLETGEIGDTGASPFPPAKIGLGVFLAVVGSLFALFFSAYLMRMNMLEPSVAAGASLPAPRILWLNTGLLILSSAALQWAQIAARRRERESLKVGLLAGGGCAVAFLVGQLIAWRQLADAGYLVTGNAAAGFFYLITAVHGLHLLGGLIALGATSLKVWEGVTMEEAQTSVELCAVYWHFLLLIWLVFFALLFLADPVRGGSGLVALICRTF